MCRYDKKNSDAIILSSAENELRALRYWPIYLISYTIYISGCKGIKMISKLHEQTAKQHRYLDFCREMEA